jgi:AcrR family transcriptional regulator
MDAIAEEAGVARSTLYRNWASRNEILASAIDGAAGAPPTLGDGPVVDQLDSVVVGLVGGLDSSEWGRALPAIVAAIAAEPELAEHYHRFTESRRTGALRIVRHGVETGQLPADLVLDDFVDALVGPLFYRRLVRGRTTTQAWARRHLTRTLVAFEAHPLK